jgi:circadian clock protein KaiB
MNAPALRIDGEPLIPPCGAWRFRLYTAGQSPRSLAALANLHALCHLHLDAGYQIEVVDLLDQPQRAAADQILAIPTLVRLAPAPRRQVVGDLSDVDRVVAALDMRSS